MEVQSLPSPLLQNSKQVGKVERRGSRASLDVKAVDEVRISIDDKEGEDDGLFGGLFGADEEEVSLSLTPSMRTSGPLPTPLSLQSRKKNLSSSRTSMLLPSFRFYLVREVDCLRLMAGGDMFGDDEEDFEDLRAQRLKEKAAKKEAERTAAGMSLLTVEKQKEAEEAAAAEEKRRKEAEEADRVRKEAEEK